MCTVETINLEDDALQIGRILKIAAGLYDIILALWLAIAISPIFDITELATGICIGIGTPIGIGLMGFLLVLTETISPDRVKTKIWIHVLNTISGAFVVAIALSWIWDLACGLGIGRFWKYFDVLDVAIVAACVPGLIQFKAGITGLMEMNKKSISYLFLSAFLGGEIGILTTRLGMVIRPYGFFGTNPYDTGILFIPFVLVLLISYVTWKRITNVWKQPKFRFAFIFLTLVMYWFSASVFSYWFYREYLSIPARIFGPIGYVIFFWPITIIPSIITTYFSMRGTKMIFRSIAVFMLLQIAAFAPLSSVPAFT